MDVKMGKARVVPDVIYKAPKVELSVRYGSSHVDSGNELTPNSVKDMPDVSWAAESGDFYVLVMTDPDAPSAQEPKLREWHHWLVGNIPGDNVSKGETLSEYIGAGPPKGTGLHRYVFLVYKQKKKLEFKEKRLSNRSVDGRAKFSTKHFAKKYNLKDPIAGNFFLAKWDDYVDILFSKLST